MAWDRDELLRAHDEAAYVCGLEPVRGYIDTDSLEEVAARVEGIAAAASVANAVVFLAAGSNDASSIVNAMRPLFTLFCAIVRQELGVDSIPDGRLLSSGLRQDISIAPQHRIAEARTARRKAVDHLRCLAGVQP